MIHVAVDANALAWGWGGIPRYIERLATLLARRDDLRLTLLTNAERPRIRIPGTREIACRRRGGVLWRNGFVAPWLAWARPQVFWAAETVVPWHVPIPFVSTVHDLAAVLFPDTKPAALRLAYQSSIPRGLRRAAAVIAVSKTTAADVSGRWGIDAARMRVIPNGIDAVFEPGDREAAAATVAAKWSLERPYVLAVGSLEPRKGLEVLIDAARSADWELVLAGRPGHRGDELRRRAIDAGARLLGSVDEQELLALYRAAEVVAAPSLYEGFGLTALEAMACGTPAVVAADSGGLVEVSGPAAVVVARREPADWVEAIASARSWRESLRRAGLAHARRFTWERAAADTAEVLHEASGAGRG